MIDTELERVDRRLAQLTRLSTELVDALNLYHQLMRDLPAAPVVSGYPGAAGPYATPTSQPPGAMYMHHPGQHQPGPPVMHGGMYPGQPEQMAQPGAPMGSGMPPVSAPHGMPQMQQGMPPQVRRVCSQVLALYPCSSRSIFFSLIFINCTAKALVPLVCRPGLPYSRLEAPG